MADWALRGLLGAGADLALVAPLALVAILRSPRPRLRWAAAALAVFLLEAVCLRAGKVVAPAERWNWAGKLVALAAVLAAGRLAGLSAAEAGLTARLRRGSLPAVAIAFAAALAIPVAYVLAGGREAADLETAAFQLTMPGLEEEIAFRGVLYALLDRAFGTRWRIAGADLGFAGALTWLAWAGLHAVDVDPGLRLHLHPLEALPPLLGGAFLTYLRARSGSVLPAVLAHGIGNEIVLLPDLLGR